MRLFIRIAILFYLLIILVIGFSALILLAHDVFTFVDYASYERLIKHIYDDPKAGMIAGVIIAVTMLISFILARIIYGRQRQERVISIDNPLGRVTISMSAIEDSIRRLSAHLPQIKEIRPDVIASRNGLKVDIRLVLHSDGNISRLTSELQELVRQKVADVVGKEERILIRIHVSKIMLDVQGVRKGCGADFGETQVSPVHYHGYRA